MNAVSWILTAVVICAIVGYTAWCIIRKFKKSRRGDCCCGDCSKCGKSKTL